MSGRSCEQLKIMPDKVSLLTSLPPLTAHIHPTITVHGILPNHFGVISERSIVKVVQVHIVIVDIQCIYQWKNTVVHCA